MPPQQKKESQPLNNEDIADYVRISISIFVGFFSLVIGFLYSVNCYLTHYSALILTGLILIICPLLVHFLKPLKSRMLFSMAVLIEFTVFVIMCVYAEYLRINQYWNNETFEETFCYTYNRKDGKVTHKFIFVYGIVLVVVLAQIGCHMVNFIVHFDYFWNEVETKVTEYYKKVCPEFIQKCF